ncbi:MAG: hypothetical protein ACK559_35965, partial [bacterium]
MKHTGDRLQTAQSEQKSGRAAILRLGPGVGRHLSNQSRPRPAGRQYSDDQQYGTELSHLSLRFLFRSLRCRKA